MEWKYSSNSKVVQIIYENNPVSLLSALNGIRKIPLCLNENNQSESLNASVSHSAASSPTQIKSGIAHRLFLTSSVCRRLLKVSIDCLAENEMRNIRTFPPVGGA